jgi:hypothetical protein
MHTNDRDLLDSADAYLSSGDSECSECGRMETCTDHPTDNDRGVCSACRDEILAEIEADTGDDGEPGYDVEQGFDVYMGCYSEDC